MRLWLLAVLASMCLFITSCEEDAPPPIPSQDAVSQLKAILAKYDSDADGLNDSIDPLPFYPGIPADTDGDGLADPWDLFPTFVGTPASAVPQPADFDRDGVPDYQDPYPEGEDTIDTDGDGIVNAEDDDPFGVVDDMLLKQLDSDGDYTPDWLDETPYNNDFGDDDGDGYTNYNDLNPEIDNDYDDDGRSNGSDYDPYDQDEW